MSHKTGLVSTGVGMWGGRVKMCVCGGGGLYPKPMTNLNKWQDLFLKDEIWLQCGNYI